MYYNKKYDDDEEKNYKKLLPIMMSLKKSKCDLLVKKRWELPYLMNILNGNLMKN